MFEKLSINKYSTKNVSKKKKFDYSDLFEEKEEKKDTVHFGFFFYVRYILGLRTEQSKKEFEYLDVIDNYVNDRLDIIQYFKFLNILDKFRWIMLNYEQNISLQYIKPINIANKEEYDMMIKPQDKMKIGYHIFTYYTKKIQDGTMTEIDEKLYSILDPEIKKMLTAELFQI